MMKEISEIKRNFNIQLNLVNLEPNASTLSSMNRRIKKLEKNNRSLTNAQYFFEEIIKKTDCNIAKLSRSIGIHRRTLYRLARLQSKNLNLINFEKLLRFYIKLIIKK